MSFVLQCADERVGRMASGNILSCRMAAGTKMQRYESEEGQI